MELKSEYWINANIEEIEEINAKLLELERKVNELEKKLNNVVLTANESILRLVRLINEAKESIKVVA